MFKQKSESFPEKENAGIAKTKTQTVKYFIIITLVLILFTSQYWAVMQHKAIQFHPDQEYPLHQTTKDTFSFF